MTNLPTDHLSGVFSTYSNGDQAVAPVIAPDETTIDARPPSSDADLFTEPMASQSNDMSPPTSEEARQVPQKVSSGEQAFPRAQLLGVLETVLEQLKQDPVFEIGPNQFSEAQQINLKLEPVSVNDRTEEIDQLKSLLIEAQETIIKLLSDRVDDRARLANLEAEAKYLPIYKKNNTEQQLGLAIEYEALRKELVRVSVELGQLEKMHASLRLKQKSASIWARFFGVRQT